MLIDKSKFCLGAYYGHAKVRRRRGAIQNVQLSIVCHVNRTGISTKYYNHIYFAFWKHWKLNVFNRTMQDAMLPVALWTSLEAYSLNIPE